VLDRLIVFIALAVASLSLILTGLIYVQAVNAYPLYSYKLVVTLDVVVEVIGSPDFRAALMNTVVVAVLQTLVGVVLGLVIALAIHRVDVPFIGRFEPLIIMPMFIAPVIWGFAWNYSYGPSGFIPLLSEFNPFVVGVICGLLHVPHAYALIASGILSMDYTLEEVARIHGSGPLRTLARVTIPILRPSITLATVLLLILGFEQFGIPLVLLSPWGYDVLTTYLYGIPSTYFMNPYPRMAVVAGTLITITISLVILQRYLALREIKRFVTIGERYRGYFKMSVSTPVKAVFAATTLLYIVGVVIIPLASLILRSIQPLYGAGINEFTAEYYLTIIRYESYRATLINTFIVALLAATLGSLIYFSYAWTIVKSSRRPISVYADLLSSMPRALPGLVAGLAFLWFYLLTPLRSLMYTHLGLALAYVIVWSALGVRLVTSSLLQISQELENVARIHGASLARTIIHIYMPLLKKSILISWLYLFILGIREYSIPVYIATKNTQVIGSTIVLLIGSGDLGIIAALSTITVIASLTLTALIFKIGWKPY
jgi:iron(III) transport system permease protein